MDKEITKGPISEREVRLRCLALAVDVFPSTARPPGGELDLAKTFVGWVLEGKEPAPSKPGPAVQERQEEEPGAGEGGDGGEGGEILETRPTPESPSGVPSLNQAKGKGK